MDPTSGFRAISLFIVSGAAAAGECTVERLNSFDVETCTGDHVSTRTDGALHAKHISIACALIPLILLTLRSRPLGAQLVGHCQRFDSTHAATDARPAVCTLAIVRTCVGAGADGTDAVDPLTCMLSHASAEWPWYSDQPLISSVCAAVRSVTTIYDLSTFRHVTYECLQSICPSAGRPCALDRPKRATFCSCENLRITLISPEEMVPDSPRHVPLRRAGQKRAKGREGGGGV